VAEDLADIGEFGVIRRLLERLPASSLIVPPGDDAAVVATAAETVVTADLLVEGRHFDLAFSSPSDVGFKALTVNVSDIAAMGGRPRYALVSIGAPAATPIGVLESLYDGIAEAARAYDVTIAGGDTVGADEIIVSVAVLGEPGAGGVVTRSGARPGDLLCVTGELGGAAAGLALLRAGGADPEAGALADRFPNLIAAHRRGVARVREGEAAAGSGARAMIDVSDGLIADAGHLCERSGVGLLLDARAVPAAPGVEEVEAWGGTTRLALSGGDDYELCIAIPPDDVDVLTRALAPTALTVIGRFVEGGGVAVSGAEVPDAPGWDSFR
jgi:thiamine-monophosphate kinase